MISRWHSSNTKTKKKFTPKFFKKSRKELHLRTRIKDRKKGLCAGGKVWLSLVVKAEKVCVFFSLGPFQKSSQGSVCIPI